jgi:hypothetical protein
MDWQKITFEDWANAFNGSQEKWKNLPDIDSWKSWWNTIGSKECDVCMLFVRCKYCPFKVLNNNKNFICCKEFNKCDNGYMNYNYDEFTNGFIGMQKLLKKLNKESMYLKWKSKLEGEI